MQVRCISSDEITLVQSLDVGHGYLLRVVGNLVQGTRLYAINKTPWNICSSHLSLYCAQWTKRVFVLDWPPLRTIVTGALLMVTASKDES
jgi:hypothetical protein